MKLRTTYDDTCPHCGQKISDLWDYDWGHSNHIEVTCPHCDQEIAVTAEIYYIISPVLDDPSLSKLSEIIGKQQAGCQEAKAAAGGKDQ